MAQRHLDPTAAAVPADALAGYLRAQATEFLRALRLHRETGAGAAASEGSAEAARALRRAARRISASLHTFQPALDPDWSEAMRPELAWVSGTLALEHAYASRLEQLLLALHRLSGAAPLPGPAGTTGTPRANTSAGPPDTSGAATLTAASVTGDHTTETADPAATATGTAPDRNGSAPDGAPVTARRAAVATANASGGTATGSPARSTVAAADSVPAAPRRTAATTASVSARTGTRATGTAPAHGAAGSSSSGPVPDRGNLTVGAAKAGALLDRQLTLARTRAHSTALQALGSSRFHGIADKVAVLASEVPLSPAAAGTDLRPLAEAARERLADAVAALPLLTAGSPYNAEALIHGLSPDAAPHPQDAPWHQVRLLLRLHRYAREVLHSGTGEEPPADPRLLTAGEALDRHRDASEAAAAAAQAARTPRIAPATAYALGVLHADQRHEVEAARYAFQRCWQKEVIGTLQGGAR
ncbi:CHAD domain-containing protein [Streptomyces griseoloalbus]|uniref:CHAD domain-containing protein n=1 Tax=Streptomyces griseoloalbus TaxID=67303 RepID=A0ABV3EFQ4_9ACTN